MKLLMLFTAGSGTAFFLVFAVAVPAILVASSAPDQLTGIAWGAMFAPIVRDVGFVGTAAIVFMGIATTARVAVIAWLEQRFRRS